MTSKLIQYIGPFKKGETLTFAGVNGWEYTHIGIETPHVLPLYFNLKTLTTESMREMNADIPDEYTPTPQNSPSVLGPEIMISNSASSVSGQQFKINKNCILEFDNLKKGNFKIIFNREMPMEAIVSVVITKKVY